MLKFQKQPSRGVLSKRSSENMQQIYRRTTMPKCDFNKVRHGCSHVNLLHIFRAPFSWNTSWWLLHILHIIDNKGGLMVFVKSHIPSRRLNDFKIPSNIQIIPFQIKLRKRKISCINSQRSVPEKQIFYLVFDKSIRILLNLA